MKKIIIFIFFILFRISIFADKLSIDFIYPSISGDFYVNGKISFQPGKVLNEDNIIVKNSKTNEEIPSKITVLEKWYDGSILEVEILFPANTIKQAKYEIVYGEDIKRRKKITQTSVLPIINASIGKTPQSTENLNMDIGELLVKVDKSSDLRYYWHFFPIFILIFFTIYRTVKNSKSTV